MRTASLLIKCIYVKGLPISEDLAHRCLRTAERIAQLKVEPFAGVPGPRARAYAESAFGFKFSEKLRDNYCGAFLSHLKLWMECARTERSMVILEHDAQFQHVLPISLLEARLSGDGSRWDGSGKTPLVINLVQSEWSDPTWRYYKQVSEKMYDRNVIDHEHTRTAESLEKWEGSLPSKAAIEDGLTHFVLSESRFTCLPSSAAYALNPEAAKKLIREVDERVNQCSDRYVNKSRITLKDCTPFPVITTGKDVSTVITPWVGYRDDEEPEKENHAETTG